MQVVNLVLELPIADCQLPIYSTDDAWYFFQIGNRQSAINNNQ